MKEKDEHNHEDAGSFIDRAFRERAQRAENNKYDYDDPLYNIDTSTDCPVIVPADQHDRYDEMVEDLYEARKDLAKQKDKAAEGSNDIWDRIKRANRSIGL